MGTGAGPRSPCATRPSPPSNPPTRSASSSSGSGSPTQILPVIGSRRVLRSAVDETAAEWISVPRADIGAVNALAQAAALAREISFIIYEAFARWCVLRRLPRRAWSSQCDPSWRAPKMSCPWPVGQSPLLHTQQEHVKTSPTPNAGRNRAQIDLNPESARVAINPDRKHEGSELRGRR